MELYNFGKRYKYPHMMPNDVEIWERFIEAQPEVYESVAYDVPVGSDPQFDTVVNNTSGGQATKLYKLKIDVVGIKGVEMDIIEIKPNAGASAVGQVLSYVSLYIRDYKPVTIPNAVLLTNRASDDTKHFASQMGVRIIEV